VILTADGQIVFSAGASALEGPAFCIGMRAGQCIGARRGRKRAAAGWLGSPNKTIGPHNAAGPANKDPRYL